MQTAHLCLLVVPLHNRQEIFNSDSTGCVACLSNSRYAEQWFERRQMRLARTEDGHPPGRFCTSLPPRVTATSQSQRQQQTQHHHNSKTHMGRPGSIYRLRSVLFDRQPVWLPASETTTTPRLLSLQAAASWLLLDRVYQHFFFFSAQSGCRRLCYIFEANKAHDILKRDTATQF